MEKQIAEAVLQEKTTVHLGHKQYEVAAPTLATLIKVSKMVSQIPEIDFNDDKEKLLSETLRIAKHCEFLGDIVAVLILGAKKTNVRRWWQRKQFKAISKEVLNECSPKELNNILTQLLSRLEIADFFVFTTSLMKINLLKSTKERGVEETTTQSGQ